MFNLIKPVTEFFEFSLVDGEFFSVFFTCVFLSQIIYLYTYFFTISLQVILFHKICFIFQFSVEAFFFHYFNDHLLFSLYKKHTPFLNAFANDMKLTKNSFDNRILALQQEV